MSDLSLLDESSAATTSEAASPTVSARAATTPGSDAAVCARCQLERASSARGEERRRRGPLGKLARVNGAVIAAGVAFAFALGRSAGQSSVR